MSDCEHIDFVALVDVARITDGDDGPVTAFHADVTIECAACHMPFCFRGMPMGLSHLGPTMSLDARTASLPIHPEDDPTTGIGSPGFNVSVHWPGEDAGPGAPGVDTSDPDDHGVIM